MELLKQSDLDDLTGCLGDRLREFSISALLPALLTPFSHPERRLPESKDLDAFLRVAFV
jgi:hypothetical protein